MGISTISAINSPFYVQVPTECDVQSLAVDSSSSSCSFVVVVCHSMLQLDLPMLPEVVVPSCSSKEIWTVMAISTANVLV